jgi:hypothetical protein
MKKTYACALLAALCLFAAPPVLAEIGVTDECQEDIEKLEDEIERDRDDYTAESVRKAKNQLMAAKTNRLNPVKCRKNIQDARQELREGKRDKKDRD